MKQFAAGAAFGLASAIVLFPVAKASISADTAAALDRFAQALTQVHDRYVHEVGYTQLVDGAIAGMVSRLDPHSSYMTPSAFKALADNTKNDQQAGVGITLESPAGVIRITSTFENGPAAEAGVRANDVITAVNGHPVEGLSLIEVLQLLKGEAGSKLTLTLIRGTPLPFNVTMTRKVILMPEGRTATYGNVGYIRLYTFNLGSSAFLHSSITDMKQKLGGHVAGYVLDLRGNAGGLLDAGVAVADTFMDSGAIVTTTGRGRSDNQTVMAKPGDEADGKPLAVLIDRNSAEDAEIVAAALQDGRRAKIVGERSAGQARVQTIIPLGKDDGALRLTTSIFTVPGGRAIDGVGVVPDIAVPEGGNLAFGGKDDAQLQAALAQLDAAPIK
jgi:carboxyl-terminal processing protease